MHPFVRPISVGCIFGVTPSLDVLLNKKIIVSGY